MRRWAFRFQNCALRDLRRSFAYAEPATGFAGSRHRGVVGIDEGGCRPDFVAGHSLGEYPALVAAGSLDFGDALRLVRKRGQYMQEAVPAGYWGNGSIAETPHGKTRRSDRRSVGR